MGLTGGPIPQIEVHRTCIPVQPAEDITHTVTTRSIKTLLRVETRLLHFTQRLVDDAQTLITESGTEGIPHCCIEFTSLFQQANSFVDMFTPTTYPANHMQGKSLIAAVDNLCCKLI